MDVETRAIDVLREVDRSLKNRGLVALVARQELRRSCIEVLDLCDLGGNAELADELLIRLSKLGGMPDWVRIRWARRILQQGWCPSDLPTLAWMNAVLHQPERNIRLTPSEEHRMAEALEEISALANPFARAASRLL